MSDAAGNSYNRNTLRFRWRLVQRALLYKRAKVLLILVALAMGCSVITALLNLEKDLRYRMNRELRDYGPNVLVLPAAGKTDIDHHTFETLKSSFVQKEITGMAPEVFLPVRIQHAQTILVGSNLDSIHRLYPAWNWIDQQSHLDHPIFVGVRLAKKMNAKPGSAVLVESNGRKETFHVAGLVEGGESEDDRAFSDLALVQDLGELRGKYHAIILSALGTIPQVQALFAGFMKSHPEARIQLIRKIAVAESDILDKISRLMGLVISIITIILFFCINTTVSAVLLARQREIALFRVLGAKRNQIMAGLTLELLVLALAGGLIGFAIGILMAQVLGKVLFQTYVLPHWSVFGITIISSLALMVISSILPIRRAINRQAALVLKEV